MAKQRLRERISKKTIFVILKDQASGPYGWRLHLPLCIVPVDVLYLATESLSRIYIK